MKLSARIPDAAFAEHICQPQGQCVPKKIPKFKLIPERPAEVSRRTLVSAGESQPGPRQRHPACLFESAAISQTESLHEISSPDTAAAPPPGSALVHRSRSDTPPTQIASICFPLFFSRPPPASRRAITAEYQQIISVEPQGNVARVNTESECVCVSVCE